MKTFGADKSQYDPRTYQHDTTLAAALPLTGGQIYGPQDIEDQSKVGICTAISLTQNAHKALGKKFSADFQYLLQKKYVDGSWTEGSSIFSALKVGKTYGFLPVELFPYTNAADRDQGYSHYVAKLQAIPDREIERLLTLCTDKLSGYAAVSIDPQSLATAINDSTSGVLCRYDVGPEWYTSASGRISWDPRDIDPIRPPSYLVGGHAIGTTYYDFSHVKNLTFANTWGIEWDVQGNCHIHFETYQPTEAWIPYYTELPPVIKPKFSHVFTQNLEYGQTSDEVFQLQSALLILGYFQKASDYFHYDRTITHYYGSVTQLAVFLFQKDHITLTPLEVSYAGRYFGPKTIAAINELLKT